MQVCLINPFYFPSSQLFSTISLYVEAGDPELWYDTLIADILLIVYQRIASFY